MHIHIYYVPVYAGEILICADLVQFCCSSARN